jgi:hypothetical protein
MRLKSELYKKEQEEIVDKIVNILDLQNKTEYTLYELDKNEEIQKQVMELIPEIRKYYSFNGIKAVGEPNKIKRPWLSIIKHLIKQKYMITTSFSYETYDKSQTQKYLFVKRIC